MNQDVNEEVRVRASAQNIRRWIVAIVSTFLIAPAIALSLSGGFAARTVLATAAARVTQTPVASGMLSEPIRVKFKQGGGMGDVMDVAHLSMMQNTTVDVSNIAIVKNIVQPGGYFGWHQHSGPSWIVITQGTLTFYDADDPSCAGVPVSAGQAYFDAGNHTHNARNETDLPVENYVVRMLPAGGAPRIDMPDPGVCAGLP